MIFFIVNSLRKVNEDQKQLMEEQIQSKDEKNTSKEGIEQQNPNIDLPRIVQVLQRQKRNADPDFHHYYYYTILKW